MIEYIRHGSRLHRQMLEWRHDFHAHPEIAYEEVRTAERVAQSLKAMHMEVTRGLGRTGVVATLHGRLGAGPSIALRADMDALAVQEQNDVAHRSLHEGRMHACGHDGHTAMLLGAAAQMALNPEFAGQVHFIFQPAEEDRAGARAMIEDGLFTRFTIDSIYGLHNWPELPIGEVAVHEGAVMAAYDTFDIVVRGRGCHGGCPHQGADPIHAASQVVLALQSIVSRNIDPLKGGVISVTQVQGGSTYNVLPDTVSLRGTARSFCADVRDQIERRMSEVVAGVSGSFGCTSEFRYHRRYPATVNRAAEARECIAALELVPGVTQIHRNPPSSMCGEDFAFMLEQRPGCYIWLGSAQQPSAQGLHSPHYDFNDEALLLGANYWLSLVRRLLGVPASR